MIYYSVLICEHEESQTSWILNTHNTKDNKEEKKEMIRVSAKFFSWVGVCKVKIGKV